MRKKSKRLLMDYLSMQIRIFRGKEDLTQEKMAEKLHITPRSYFDLEHGKSGFSAMSLIYFLLLLSDEDIIKFIGNFRKLLQRSEKDVA